MKGLKINYKILALGKIRLTVTDDPHINSKLDTNRAAIEEIWQDFKKKKGGKLFNGTLANFIKINKKKDSYELISQFIEYKQFFAQISKPALKLGITPIGVSGIIVLEDKAVEYVIFSRRADDVTEYPGFYELVPSGSIDKQCLRADGVIDYPSKLLSEFIEETGLSKKYIKEITGFTLVLDKNHHVYDIGCRILLEAKKKEILEDFSSTEYGIPVFVPTKDLGDFIKMNNSSIVPTSMALIEAYRQYFKQEN